MARKSNYFNFQNPNDRMWSDDQGYLDTLSGLINKAHEASMDAGQDVYDWFWVLEQLQLEIDGQLVKRELNEDFEELEALRLATRKKIDEAYTKVGSRVGNLSPADASRLRDLVYPYNRALQILIHKLDLRLHDVETKNSNVPTWSDNT